MPPVLAELMALEAPVRCGSAGFFLSGNHLGRSDAANTRTSLPRLWLCSSRLDGATISKDQAVPYIVNFTMVDGDGDGKITADEFKAGCAKGMVKSTQP